MIILFYLEVLKGPQMPKPSTCTCQSLVLGFFYFIGCIGYSLERKIPEWNRGVCFSFLRNNFYRCSATRLSWLFSFRPVALRPRFSTSLPFRSVSLTKLFLIYARIMQNISGTSESKISLKSIGLY